MIKKIEWEGVDPGNIPRTLDGERIDNEQGYDIDDYRIVNIDLTQTKIKNKTFINLEFHCVKFNYTEISNTQFCNCIFNETTFKKVKMKNIFFDVNTFNKTIFDTCKLDDIQSVIDLEFTDKVELKNTIATNLKPEDSVVEKTHFETIFDSLVELLKNGAGELEDVTISAPKKQYSTIEKDIDLNNCHFEFITFVNLSFENINFIDSDFTSSRFINCDFKDCSFEGANLKSVFINSCNLSLNKTENLKITLTKSNTAMTNLQNIEIKKLLKKLLTKNKISIIINIVKG